MLGSKSVEYQSKWKGLRNLETLRPLMASLLHSGITAPGLQVSLVDPASLNNKITCLVFLRSIMAISPLSLPQATTLSLRKVQQFKAPPTCLVKTYTINYSLILSHDKYTPYLFPTGHIDSICHPILTS